MRDVARFGAHMKEISGTRWRENGNMCVLQLIYIVWAHKKIGIKNRVAVPLLFGREFFRPDTRKGIRLPNRPNAFLGAPYARTGCSISFSFFTRL
jgi:hypothetical protein